MRRVTVDPIMLRQRAAAFATRSIKGPSKIAALRLAMSMVDLTTLEGKDSPQKVQALCRKAIHPHIDLRRELKFDVPSVAAVCVYPSLVAVAKEALLGSHVKVASVATGFPSGQYPIDVKLSDAARAVQAGADEIDMVINRGAFLAGRYDEVADEIRQVKAACGSAHLKIILETGELETYDNVRRASDLAIDAAAATAGGSGKRLADGEVFIKTSTGKVSPAATMASSLVMLQAIADHFRATGTRIGLKPAGGIRSARQALHYLVMVKETLGDDWLNPRLFRFGASALANDIIRQMLRQATGRYAARYDLAEA